MPALASAEQLFASTVQKSSEWVHELMRELEIDDPREAYAALRATLHALRDRLTLQENVQLAAQLPTLIRGMYFEGWKPQATPKRIRRLDEFEAQVHWEAHRQFKVTLDRVIRAVFKVLSRRISSGEINDVVRILPEELRAMWP
nr:hypothetical protein [uncultured bacterium]